MINSFLEFINEANKMPISIFFKEYDGFGLHLFIHRIKKEDNLMIIELSDGHKKMTTKITVSKNSFKFGDSDIHFFSYYTKRSKYQDYVRFSRNLYDIIKANFEYPPPFITPATFEDLGWTMNNSSHYKVGGTFYFLHDNNRVLFEKDDLKMIFDFNFYELTIYDNKMQEKEKRFIKSLDDLNILDNI